MNTLSAVFLVYCVLLNKAGKAENYEEWYQRISQLREVSDSDAAFYKSFQTLKNLIAAGDSRYPLDPLVIPSLGPFTYTAASVSVDITLTNLKLEGLKSYKIEDVIVDAVNHIANVKTSLPWISISGEYLVAAPELFIPEPASGTIDLFLTNPEVNMRIEYQPTELGHIVLNFVDISLEPGTTSIKLGNHSGSRILNEVINIYVQAAAAKNLRYEMPVLLKLINQEATPYLARYLNEHNFHGVPLRSFNHHHLRNINRYRLIPDN